MTKSVTNQFHFFPTDSKTGYEADSQGHDEEYEDEDDYADRDEYPDEEDEEEDEDDYDDGINTMFEKRATLYTQNSGDADWKMLAMGTLKIVYDDDIYGAKILVENDKKEIVSETVISMDTDLQVCEKNKL